MRKRYLIICFCFAAFSLQGQYKFTLPLAIEFATEHSNQMAMAKLDVLDAQETVEEFKAIGKPTLDIGANYSYYFIRPSQPTEDFLTPAVFGILNEFVFDTPVDPGPPQTFNLVFLRRNNLNGYLDFRALLFDGVFLKGLKAAKASIDVVKSRSKLTEREIAVQVTQAYLAVLIAKENHKIIKSNIESLERLLFETTETYKAGFAERLDVNRLTLTLENLKVEDENLTELIELSKNVLKFQMNFPLDTDIVLLDELEVLLNKIEVDTDILLTAESIDYSNRPEVEVLEKAIELDELDIDRLGIRLPVLKANINLQESLQRDKLFNGNEAGLIPGGFVGLSLNYNIFDGNLKNSQRQRSRIRMEQKSIELEEFKRGMYLQATNAQRQLTNAKRTLLNRRKILDLAEKVYSTAKIKFKEGVGSSLEINQSETGLYRAQSDLIAAMYDVILAKTDLDIALGNIK
jgi:outer membrane protein TolC